MDAAMEKGRIKYGSICAGCHGKNGEGQGIFPKVAGKSAEELAAKLKDYRAGKKLGEQTAMMAPNAQNLSDEEIDALANYMAGLKG
jgi:cytochrome c553